MMAQHSGVALALVGGFACSSGAVGEGQQDGGAGQAGQGGMSAGGAGGAGGVSAAEECVNRDTGSAGAICTYCAVATIELSEPVAGLGVGVELETSLGHTFSELPSTVRVDTGSLALAPNTLGGFFGPEELKWKPGDPIERLLLSGECGGELLYSPEWFAVRVYRDDVELGAQRFGDLRYSCIPDEGGHHHCWESAPVTLQVSEP